MLKWELADLALTLDRLQKEVEEDLKDNKDIENLAKPSRSRLEGWEKCTCIGKDTY
jgi:hypothetical protein